MPFTCNWTNDTGHSANGKFFNNLLKKKIIFFPDCNISLVDVRNLSQVISNVLINEDFDNSKVIVNDTSITIKDYIEQIKFNEKNYIKIKINLFYLKILFLLNQILIKMKLTKKDFISKNRIKYIEINPITELTNQKRKISFNQTILDTRNFFLKKYFCYIFIKLNFKNS